MPLLQQATDGRMLHRMWRGLRMKCKNCKHLLDILGENGIRKLPRFWDSVFKENCSGRFCDVIVGGRK